MRIRPSIPNYVYRIPIGSWLVLIVAALILGALTVFFTDSYKQRLAKEIYKDTAYELNANASALSSVIGSKLNLANGIKAFAVNELTHNGHISQERFDTFASNFMGKIPGIRNFSLYPDGVAGMVYPLEGNEALLGLRLFQHSDESVRLNAERTRMTDDLTVLGPLELAQGGTGILSRQSIYWNDRFWGFVSVVLDIPPIFLEAGLYNGDKGIDFAVRANGRVLMGNPLLFDDPPLYETVSLPEGQWEIAAVPNSERFDSILFKVRIVQAMCWVTFALILIFLYTQFTQKAKLRQLVQERTRNLESANRQLEETFRELAVTAYQDAVTGLHNRSSFNETLSGWIGGPSPSVSRMALLYLDMDQFKMINDTLGHLYGDILLKEIGRRLSGEIPDKRTLFRIGGDEFTILLPDYESVDQVRQFAQRLCDLFREPFILKDAEYFITTSIGVSLYPEHGQDNSALVRNADLAMYRAKEEGKNQFRFFDTTLNPNAEESMEIAGYLRRAVEKDELVLHYQPQVEARTGKIIGMEALVRWKHPTRGLLPPNSFIAIAEETGLILPIGEKVLHLACAQSIAWQRAGLPPVRIAVNLSARQFAQKGFAERIGDILGEHGLEPRYVELEITENTAMKDGMQPVLQGLRDQGFTISIDDFGTQYSSLNYLKKLPVDKIKIDRSFVSGISRDRKDEAIIVAMLQIADRLNLTVIAEGVETNEQLEFLLQNRCQEIQGFIFHKPQPADRIERLLAGA